MNRKLVISHSNPNKTIREQSTEATRESIEILKNKILEKINETEKAGKTGIDRAQQIITRWIKGKK